MTARNRPAMSDWKVEVQHPATWRPLRRTVYTRDDMTVVTWYDQFRQDNGRAYRGSALVAIFDTQQQVDTFLSDPS